MDNTEALARLKDIHLPAPVSWWPLAPGWYLLFIITAICVGILCHRIYKRYVYALPKKQALVLLNTYMQHYEKDKDARKICSHISELLKRVALVYYPRSKVASVYGEGWIAFLNETSKGIEFNSIKTLLLDLPFKTDNSAPVDIKPLATRASLWIKQRRVPWLN